MGGDDFSPTPDAVAPLWCKCGASVAHVWLEFGVVVRASLVFVWREHVEVGWGSGIMRRRLIESAI